MYKLSVSPDIKKALVVFSIVLLTMVSIVTMSDMYRTDASNENSIVSREMRSWRNKIDEANRNNQILVQHEDTFKRLQADSIIGDENRLSWVEVVQQVADSRGIASVKYNIASQVLVDKNQLHRKYKDLDVYKSVMSIEMKFIHEGDLFVMLNALRNEAKGLMTVDKCDVELINKDVNEGVIGQDNTDNMRAYCEISWYTLKKAGKV
ncbi:MAG: hypothetical protein JSW45_08545 [Thiotrichales bacterium]|nr:MAG: hypothetical protein JSW45_08545 [Thiotrichales bacterium]